VEGGREERVKEGVSMRRADVAEETRESQGSRESGEDR
jgi:hypothetical protein